jgi:multidrug efflux system membrane fusion protein
MKIEDLPRESGPREQRRNRRGGLLLIAMLLVIAGLTGWWLWPKHPTSVAAPPVPVNAGHPVRRNFPIRVSATGTVQALNTVDMKVRVDGQLQRIAFTEGQDVQAGKVLAQLDQGPLKAQLLQAQAAQRKDQASLDNARLDLDRYSKLVVIGAATSQSVDAAKAQVASYAAMVAADAALVQNDQLQLGFTTLHAPFTGRVGAREADLGAIVHPGDATGIVTVTQMEPITVVFSVPQDVLPEILDHQAQAPLPVHVTTRAGSEALADGQLVFVDSAVDPATGQIRLKASFRNKDRKLWPGELVNARVQVSTQTQQIAVPSRAIVNTQNGTQVYVVTADGHVQLRPVTTGVSVDGMTQVMHGVAPHELVVFDGQSRLNPGTHVAASIIGTSAQAPGTAGGAS